MKSTADEVATDPGVAAPPPAPQASGGGDRALIVMVGNQRFAIPIAQVEEVVELGATTAIPGTVDWFVGLTSVRGELVSLIDLGRFIGCPGYALRHCVITLVSGDPVGFIVDEVIGLGDIEQVIAEDQQYPGEVAPPGVIDFELIVADSRLSRIAEVDE